MGKYLLSFLFVFLMLSAFSFAKDNDTKLQKEYGYDLTKAPFFLRFAYSREFNKDWDKTDYAERQAFLAEYDSKSAAEQAREQAEAKAESDKEKELAQEKKDEQRKQRDRLRAQLAQERADKLAEEERQREFDQSVRDQQEELKEMKREATQGNE